MFISRLHNPLILTIYQPFCENPRLVCLATLTGFRIRRQAKTTRPNSQVAAPTPTGGAETWTFRMDVSLVLWGMASTKRCDMKDCWNTKIGGLGRCFFFSLWGYV